MRRPLGSSLLALAACAGAPSTPAPVEVALPASGLHARFDDRGASLGDGMRVHLVSWGRDRGTAVAPVAPTGGGSRITYVHPGLTEWWVPLPGGVEQGWTVAERPGGEGPLTFRVAVDAAELEASPALGRATDRAGRSWSIDRVAAWDTEGRSLPARFGRSGEDLLVEVDDRGAAFPVTVDPVYASAATTVHGSVDYEFLGFDVTTAGDVNGDGFDDVAFGARDYDRGGRVDVHLGSAGGLGPRPATVLRGPGVPGAEFGTTVAGGLDVNGDGFDDLAVGARERDEVSLFLGSAAGLSTRASRTLRGVADTHFGWDLDAAGDVNGDGFGDLVIGADFVDNGSSPFYEGEARICNGSPSGLVEPCTVIPSYGIVQLGYSVAGAGDVNGDGYDDVVLGTNWALAFVMYGSAAGITEDGYAELGDGAGTPAFGRVVTGGGDVNGDGFADLAVGDPGYDANRGRVSVFLGSADGVVVPPAHVFEGSVQGEQFGGAMDLGGDVDGDGYADLVVGASDGEGLGRVSLFHGSAAGLRDEGLVLTEALAGSSFGYAVGLGADVDADGRDDLLVGASSWWTHYGWGSAYVYRGYRDDDRDGSPVELDCDDQDPGIQWEVEVPGDGVDQDCDGSDLCFVDADGDGARTEATVQGAGVACDGPGEASAAVPAGDCDDVDAAVNPEADEAPGDEVDQDCDGREPCFADADGDGFRTDETVDGDDVTCDGSGEARASAAVDCDDAAEDVNPDATDIPGDGVDQDCADGDAERPSEPSSEAPEAGDEGHGCASAPGLAGGWLLVGLPALLGRRRRA